MARASLTLLLFIVGCDTAAPADAGGEALDARGTDVGTDAGPPPPGLTTFTEDVQPALVEHCAPCHVGRRFGFASLERAGAVFTEDETRRNYETFLEVISLDAP